MRSQIQFDTRHRSRGRLATELARSFECGRFALLLTLAAVVLFIVALATPAVIQTSGDILPGTTFHGKYGPFRVCSHLNSESDSCKAVDGHCEFSLRPVSGVEIKVPVVKDCDKWNAARGLLVIAAIAAIIAFLLQLVAVTSSSASRGVRGGAAFLALLFEVSVLPSLRSLSCQ